MTDKQRQYMQMAIDASVENVKNGGGPFGAVIVRNDEVVAVGTNRVTANNDPKAQAEVMAIRAACQKLNTFRLTDCEIYTSCEPCPMCLSAIYWSGIRTIFYGNNAQDAAKIGFSDQFIYDELKRPLIQRVIPAINLMRHEAQAAFRAWEEKEDKVEY